MFVRLLNRTSRSLHVTRDTFAIEGPGKRFAALAPDRIAGSTEAMRELELPPETLRPGEEASGFLYFERVAGTWGILALRATLVDAVEQQLIGTVDVRFQQATIRGCTLRDLEETAPWPRGSLFDTCLVPTYAR
jgi:hypothetical protein